MAIGKQRMVKQDRNPGGRPTRPVKTPAKDPTGSPRVHSQSENPRRREQPSGTPFPKKTK